MRINGSNAAAAATAPAAKRAAAAGTFSLGETEATRTPSAPLALRTIGGIDALIALQGLEDATERRRQGVRRGRLALDALDELKIGVLGGTLSQATMGKLKSAAALLKGNTGEAGLDSVLGEIELRLEVELAKMARQ